MKKCTKCDKTKNLSEFFWRSKKDNKKHSQCKECYKKFRKDKQYYQENKEHIKEKNSIRRERVLSENRTKYAEFIADKACNMCGEADPVVLEFHHIKRKTKRQSVSRMMNSYNWETILEEINKCEILCANCHKKETAKQFSWWKSKL